MAEELEEQVNEVSEVKEKAKTEKAEKPPVDKMPVEITLECAPVVNYYQVQNGISPIRRLYVKNRSNEDKENLKVRVTSQPDFMLPYEIEQAILPRRTNAKFDCQAKLSPLFMVAVDKTLQGLITVEVLFDDEVVAKQSCEVQITAFNECNYEGSPESLATFVKRTPQVNQLMSLIEAKLKKWNLPSQSGYTANTNKNYVRNYFAAAFSVLNDQRFEYYKSQESKSEMIQTHKDLLEGKVATATELALLYASLIEANGQNAVIGHIGDEWYVGVFTTNECLPLLVSDDVELIAQKAEKDVNEFTLVAMSDTVSGVSFEKAEKNAFNAIKKDPAVDFIVDIKRARIMHIYPLPERVLGKDGYDLVQSRDYITSLAPKQFKEYGGDVGGEKEISRVAQWERRLLDMDMRNALLNFKVSRSAVKLLVPTLDDFIGAMSENKAFVVDPKPRDGATSLEKITDGFERSSFLKPFVDYVGYEYKNKRLLTVYDQKSHEGIMLRLFRKEQSIQEETGTSTLYLSVGFLKWKENENAEEKYAPLLLYPVSLSKKGVASPVYTLDVNVEDVRLNSTLLEFLYQEFNLDIRGLSSVQLDSQQNILSVIARIKKETVGFKGWEIMSNVFLATLSFGNYQLWYDVKYKSEKFKEHPIVNSLINNKLELPEDAFNLSDSSSDEAYTAEDRMYLPISADSSQYSAIKDSLSKSFVLHGPPGTGKSQTITNIIANNIVRGKRVLFVAEKMAALSVVHHRLQSIGLGDFCLELHSNKTNKNTVLSQIVNTLSLAESKPQEQLDDDKLQDINDCIDKLERELEAMHRKRYLGISLYQGIMGYFENQDSPDCLRIDSIFYEKLVGSTFNKYIDILTELTMRAKECGDIEKSPFRHIGGFNYSEKWSEEGNSILEIYLMELKHLRQYARTLMPLFNMRTVALTTAKLKALYRICKALHIDYIQNYFKSLTKQPRGIVQSYLEAESRVDTMLNEYTAKYGTYPEGISSEELIATLKSGSISSKIKRVIPSGIDKRDRWAYVEYLSKCEQIRSTLRKREEELADILQISPDDSAKIKLCTTEIDQLYENAQKLYAELNNEVFEDSCFRLVKFGPNAFMLYYQYAYESCAKAEGAFCKIFSTRGYSGGNDINSKIEYLTSIQKNFDFIPNWCKYQEIVEKCKASGLDFILEPLNDGEISAVEVLSCFKKCVYFNFVRSELLLDDVLCQFSGLTLEELANKFKELTEDYERWTKGELYNKLVAGIPRPDEEGDHNLERVVLMRAEKSGMKGTTLRNLFAKIPNILAKCCPCMLMSPTSVTQFLDIDSDNKFDLVIFDEASQLPTCKAIGCIARGKNVIVVGDPQQLPPTTFFNVDYKDDEHYEIEDLDSILDDCLALGMPQNHLLWHYRSLHESLIAFSNAMYYGNTLLTFPSPNELNSKVSFRYVDGVYERGGAKHNKKEGDELVEEVIRRLKDPQERKYSIGIVTFNMAQQVYIENELSKRLHEHKLDQYAYDREEPIFVKNLENVQGDERDLILFSVGYGPDKNGKLSLNFGPINQNGGYKRLNVAVTRARNEMIVFSGITGNMIDLNRTNSKGVEGLKAFLEYAERGKDMLAISNMDIVRRSAGISELLGKELKDRGILCDYNVGVSDFKIDVAVVDPKNKHKYILAILADSENSCKLKGVRDRVMMQTKILRKLGWNTYQLWTVNYFNNPRREIQKIKDYIATLTQKKVLSKKAVRDTIAKYRVPYKAYPIKPMMRVGTDYVLDIVNEERIKEKIRAIIEKESPIELHCLMDKLTFMFNLPKSAKKAIATLQGYVAEFDTFKKEVAGKVFYVDKSVDTFRPSDAKVKRDIATIYPEEILAAVKCAIESNIGLDRDGVIKEVIALFAYGKKTKTVVDWIDNAIDIAIDDRQLMVTVDGKLST